jgi:hypothetical protein
MVLLMHAVISQVQSVFQGLDNQGGRQPQQAVAETFDVPVTAFLMTGNTITGSLEEGDISHPPAAPSRVRIELPSVPVRPGTPLDGIRRSVQGRSEEHTSELQSLS